MNPTSTAPDSVASVTRPELAANMNSAGTPSCFASSLARSTVTPCGSPFASLTTKKAEAAGAKTIPTRSLPVGMSSFTAVLSCALAPHAAIAAANRVPHDCKNCIDASSELSIFSHVAAIRGVRLRLSSLLARLDLVELGERAFEFAVEQPHRVENFAEACRRFRPVGLSEREDAVVAQISHDRGVGDPVIGQIAGIERSPGRTRNDLNELEQLHLIDRIWQCLHDRGYTREHVCMRVHERVSHRGPVIVSMIQIAN